MKALAMRSNVTWQLSAVRRTALLPLVCSLSYILLTCLCVRQRSHRAR